MAFRWAFSGSTGQTYYTTIQRSDNEALYFLPNAGAFGVPASFSDCRIPMPEGSSWNAGSYSTNLTNLPAGRFLVIVRVHNSGGTQALAASTVWIDNGDVVRPDASILGRSSPDDVREQVVDALTTQQIDELIAMPPSSATVAQMLQFLYMGLRNKSISTNDKLQFTKADGTPFVEATITETPTTLTRDSMRDSV